MSKQQQKKRNACSNQTEYQFYTRTDDADEKNQCQTIKFDIEFQKYLQLQVILLKFHGQIEQFVENEQLMAKCDKNYVKYQNQKREDQRKQVIDPNYLIEVTGNGSLTFLEFDTTQQQYKKYKVRGHLIKNKLDCYGECIVYKSTKGKIIDKQYIGQFNNSNHPKNDIFIEIIYLKQTDETGTDIDNNVCSYQDVSLSNVQVNGQALLFENIKVTTQSIILRKLQFKDHQSIVQGIKTANYQLRDVEQVEQQIFKGKLFVSLFNRCNQEQQQELPLNNYEYIYINNVVFSNEQIIQIEYENQFININIQQQDDSQLQYKYDQVTHNLQQFDKGQNINEINLNTFKNKRVKRNVFT